MIGHDWHKLSGSGQRAEKVSSKSRKKIKCVKRVEESFSYEYYWATLTVSLLETKIGLPIESICISVE